MSFSPNLLGIYYIDLEAHYITTQAYPVDTINRLNFFQENYLCTGNGIRSMTFRDSSQQSQDIIVSRRTHKCITQRISLIFWKIEKLKCVFAWLVINTALVWWLIKIDIVIAKCIETNWVCEIDISLGVVFTNYSMLFVWYSCSFLIVD